MLAATYTQNADFRVQDVPEPKLGSGDLLLRVQAASICATDLKIVRHGHRKLRQGQRIVLGHEFAGEIADTRGETGPFKTGQRVGVAPNIGCGVCDACILGRGNYCPHYAAFGINFDGAHAPLVRVPAEFVRAGNVVAIPDALNARDAAIMEPLSCVVASLRAACVELGDTVVIYGAGPMGLMHVLLCRLSGAAQIVVVDPQESRLEKARTLGADQALNPARSDVKKKVMELTDGRGAHVAFVACPVPEAQAEATSILAPFGRLCIFAGLPAGAEPISFDSNAVHYRNLTVTGTTGGTVQDYRAALRLAVSRRVPIESLIAATFPVAELEGAYRCAQNGVDGKVVLLGE